jgi:DNA polymerase-3 subunit chi
MEGQRRERRYRPRRSIADRLPVEPLTQRAVTQVDFYILADDSVEARLRVACRLADKAVQRQLGVFLLVESEQDAQKLDELLWTFRAGSFVPHALDEEAAAGDAPIHIGHGEQPSHHDEVLINLAPEVPLFFSRFDRVAEPVDADPPARAASRERFKFYRDRGYQPNVHKLD